MVDSLRRLRYTRRMQRVIVGLLFFFCLAATARADGVVALLNASYDPTRAFYRDYNGLFYKHWKDTTGGTAQVRQSHGGSGKQARAVIDGLRADVVTLALAYDIDAIAEKSGRVAKDWRTKFPHDSVPFTSSIVFLVRAGNPKHIADWDDLTRADVTVMTPNPKTSGGARWNYLAAWGYALKKYAGDEKQAENFMRALFARVPVLDAGARGSMTSFGMRGMGDVLIAWESEALLAKKQFRDAGFEIIIPSLSIRAETPVAVVDAVVDAAGTREAAEEYLRYLYSPEAQKLAMKHHLRPITLAPAGEFPAIRQITVEELGGWPALQAKHFAEGGVFDRIYGTK